MYRKSIKLITELVMALSLRAVAYAQTMPASQVNRRTNKAIAAHQIQYLGQGLRNRMFESRSGWPSAVSSLNVTRRLNERAAWLFR